MQVKFRDLQGSLLIFFIPLSLYLVSLSFFPIQSDDLFMYLALGKKIWASKSFPLEDPFLFSIPHSPLHTTHEWLGHLLSYALYSLGGLNIFIFLKVLILLLPAVLLYSLARSTRSLSPLIPLVALIGFYAASQRFIVRTSLLSNILTCTLLFFLFRGYLEHHRKKWILPLLFFIWAQFHPGFLLGLVILGIYLFFQILKSGLAQNKSSCFILLACLFATCIHPDLWNAPLYPLNAYFSEAFADYKKYYFEWMSPLKSRYGGTKEAKLFFLLLVVTWIHLLTTLPKYPWFEIALVLIFTYLGLSAVRYIPTASFSLILVNQQLSTYHGFLKAEKKWLIPALASLVFLLAMKNFIWGYRGASGHRKIGLGIDPVFVPLKAMEFIKKNNLKGPIFNEHSLGSLMAYSLGEEFKSYYHGFVVNSDFYKNWYISIARGPEYFQRIVNKFGIKIFLLGNLPPQAAPFHYKYLEKHREWNLVYRDQAAQIYVKK